MSNALEKFIESEIPDLVGVDVVWKDKMIDLVTKAFKLAEMLELHDKQVKDCEFRVYGISNTIGLEKDVDNMSDEEWVELAEQFGYISTLDTFIYNVNKGNVEKNYPHLQFRVVPVGYYRKYADSPKEVDIVPKNKLQYIIRD